MPTPIQTASIPSILMGRDILGSAQTGTGKTASFTLPMIDILASGRAKARMPRSLILAPTRELAAQVAETFEKFSVNHKMNMALLIGGVSFSEQDTALSKGVDVLVATPGRLLDHFERGKVLLQDVKILVIDEADRMLDMGFIPDVEKIVSYLPIIRQTLFFSATLSEEIHTIGQKFVMNPKLIEVAKPATTADTISQNLLRTSFKQKRAALRDLISSQDIENAVIFCNRKRDISTLLSSMKRHGFSATALHGDMTQSARLAALDEFKSGQIPLLIASDVAARGLDIPSVSHVFNFDVPSNADDYVHRVGRTGRAGRHGHAFTLIACEDDEKAILAIEKLIGQSIPVLSKSKQQSGDNLSSRRAEKPTKKQRKNKKLENIRSDNLRQQQTKSERAEQHTSRNPAQGEKRPPAWKGNSFKDCDHIPAFLR